MADDAGDDAGSCGQEVAAVAGMDSQTGMDPETEVLLLNLNLQHINVYSYFISFLFHTKIKYSIAAIIHIFF